MTAPVATAHVARAMRRAAFARLLRRLTAEHDVSLSDVARILGVHHSRASRYVDPADEVTLSAADVEALPPALLDALLATWAEQRGLVLAAAPDAIEQGDDLRALASIIRECGEVSARFAEAVSDGVVSAAEAERVEREADEAIRVLVALRERCRFAAKQHGDGVRRAK